jgi:hypothetical protein
MGRDQSSVVYATLGSEQPPWLRRRQWSAREHQTSINGNSRGNGGERNGKIIGNIVEDDNGRAHKKPHQAGPDHDVIMTLSALRTNFPLCLTPRPRPSRWKL